MLQRRDDPARQVRSGWGLVPADSPRTHPSRRRPYSSRQRRSQSACGRLRRLVQQHGAAGWMPRDTHLAAGWENLLLERVQRLGHQRVLADLELVADERTVLELFGDTSLQL